MEKRRRVLSVWLPRLATDIHARTAREGKARPLAAILALGGRSLVAATSAQAEAEGVRPGLTLADARALLPALIAFAADPAGDAGALARLAGWALRYTPWTAVDGADGLILDITGAAHLFGGEAPLLADLGHRLGEAGFESRAAIADTPAAAWAVARFAETGAGVVVAPGEARAALDPLPVAALRLPAAMAEGLSELGLRRIGDLRPLPRANLAARFGPLPGRRLDQALGWLDEPISPHRPVTPHHARLAFAEPIGEAPAIAAALARLLDMLVAGLERSGEGACRLELAAHRVDRRVEEGVQTLAIGASRPSRDVAALARLFALKLDRLEPGPGFEVMTLSAPVVARLIPGQERLDGSAGDATRLGELVDRLENRLGAGNVLRLVPRQSWLPERMVAAGPVFANRALLDEPGWPVDRPRPVRLFTPPEPIAVTAPLPDDPPLLFSWRRVVHRVRRADGPERLAAEWWRRDGETRDYYRVEDVSGRRFWLFRLGFTRPDTTARWFLHGVFG